MIKFIVSIFLSILFVPALSVSSYVYYKHSLYCDNRPTFESKYIQININVSECSAWESSKEEFGAFFTMIGEQNDLSIGGPEDDSHKDKANRLLDSLRGS
jgi:hypothetical protein